MNRLRSLGRAGVTTPLRLLFGKGRVCFITPTGYCNAKCTFCDVWKEEKPASAPRDKLLDAIDRLAELGVCFVQFTGGEPLMYPHLEDAIRRSKANAMVVNVVSNGSLLTGERIKRLLAAGVDSVAISIDHPSEAVHERIRGLPGVVGRIRQAVRILRDEGVLVLASTVLARFNAGLLDKLLEGNEALGFHGTGITYPTRETASWYPIGRGSADLIFAPGELAEALEWLLRLKQRGYRVFNSRAGIEDMLHRARGERPRFPCRAGDRLFSLDHQLRLNRCLVLEESYGPIEKVHPSQLAVKAECDRCMMMCFREPSILFSGSSGIRPAMEHAQLALRIPQFT